MLQLIILIYVLIISIYLIAMEDSKQLQQFIKDELQEYFCDQQKQLSDIINTLQSCPFQNLLTQFSKILQSYQLSNKQKKMIVEEFKKLQYYKTIQKFYQNEKMILKQLFMDNKQIQKDGGQDLLEYKLNQLIINSLVLKSKFLKQEYIKLTNKQPTHQQLIKDCTKAIRNQLEQEDRITKHIMYDFNCIQKDKGSLFNNLTSIKRQLNPIDVFDLNRLIQKTKISEAQISNKSIILFIGDTGSGKTTTILSLLGFPMMKKKLKGMTWITTSEVIMDQKLKLLQTSPELKSITRYPLAILPKQKLDKNQQIWFVDTPGFGDSAGSEVDLANGIGTIKAIKGCKNVRIVVMISSQSWGSRGKGIRNLAKLLGEIFNDYQKVTNSVTYIFNRFSEQASKDLNTTLKNIIENLSIDEKTNINLLNLYADLIKKTQIYSNIIFYDPLIKDAYKKILNRILSTPKLQNPRDYFSFAFSQSTKHSIKHQINIFDTIIKYYFKQQKFKKVKQILSNFNLFAQLIPYEFVKIQYQNTKNYLQNIVNKRFGGVQLKINRRLSENILTNQDLNEYLNEMNDLEKLKCLENIISIQKVENFVINLQSQMQNFADKCKNQREIKCINFDQIILLIKFCRQNKKLNLKGQKMLMEIVNQQCKVFENEFQMKLYQKNILECISLLKILKILISVRSKLDDSVNEKTQLNKYLEQITEQNNQFYQHYQKYLQDFEPYKCKKMNQILNYFQQLTTNYNLLILLQDKSNSVKQNSECMRTSTINKIQNQFKQIYQLLSQLSTNTDSSNKIQKKLQTLKKFKQLNCAVAQINLKQQIFHNKVNSSLIKNRDLLKDFCRIVQNKAYSSNKKKLKLILSNFQNAISEVQNLEIFCQDKDLKTSCNSILEEASEFLQTYINDRLNDISKIKIAINTNLGKQQITETFNLLQEIFEQLKVFQTMKSNSSSIKEYINNIMKIKNNIQQVFKYAQNTVEELERSFNPNFKVLNQNDYNFDLSEANIRLNKIQNSLLILKNLQKCSNLQIQEQVKQLKQRYNRLLKLFWISINTNVKIDLQKLKNHSISDSYLICRNLKKLIDYLIEIEQYSLICDIIQCDVSQIYGQFVKEIQNRYDEYSQSFDKSKQKKNNAQIDRLSILCSNHTALDKYMKEYHRSFQKLNVDIRKEIEIYFSKTLIKIAQNFRTKDFLTLRNVLINLSEDKTNDGKKSFLEAKEYIIKKMTESYSELINQKIKLENFQLNNEVIQYLPELYKIKTNIAEFIEDYNQYELFEKNLSVLENHFQKKFNEIIQKIKQNIDTYDLQQALIECQNLKKIQDIIQIKNNFDRDNKGFSQLKDQTRVEEEEGMLQYDKYKLKILQKIQKIEKSIQDPNCIIVNKQFFNIYRKIFRRNLKDKRLLQIKEQSDAKFKKQIKQMIQKWLTEENIDVKQNLYISIKENLEFIPQQFNTQMRNYLAQLELKLKQKEINQQKQFEEFLNSGVNEKIFAERYLLQKQRKNIILFQKLQLRINHKCDQIYAQTQKKTSLYDMFTKLIQMEQLNQIYQNQLINTPHFMNILQNIEIMAIKHMNQIKVSVYNHITGEKQYHNHIEQQYKGLFRCFQKLNFIRHSQKLKQQFMSVFKNLIIIIIQQVNTHNSNIQEMFQKININKEIAHESIKQLNLLKKAHEVIRLYLQSNENNIVLILDLQKKQLNDILRLDISNTLEMFVSKIEKIIIFFRQFSFRNKELMLNKNEYAAHFNKIRFDLLLLGSYQGSYKYLKKQDIKNYYQDAKNKLESASNQFYNQLINDIEKLIQQDYEQLNVNIEIISKYQQIVGIKSKQIKYTNQIFIKLKNKVYEFTDFGSLYVEKLKCLIENQKYYELEKQFIKQKAQITRIYGQKLRQKQIEKQKGLQNTFIREQKQKIQLLLGSEIQNLKKQFKQQINFVTQQQNEYNQNKMKYFQKKKNQIHQNIAKILTNLKKININIVLIRQFTDSQIYKIIKCYKNNIPEGQYKNFIKSLQNIKDYASEKLLVDLSKLEGIKHKVQKQISTINMDEFINLLKIQSKNKKQNLKSIYKRYLREYNNVINLYKSSKQNLSTIYNNINNIVSNLKYKYKNRIPHDGQLLIANISAIWTIINATQTQNKFKYAWELFPSQIIAIFIILGIGSIDDDNQIINRFAEVKARQGKSLILGIVSCYLALLGYDIYCACQTIYLADKNKQNYRELLYRLGVSQRIRYSTLQKICQQNTFPFKDWQQQIKNKLKVEESLTFNLKNNKIVNVSSDKQKILLFDEINVFFDQNYYGKYYNPLIKYKDESIYKLFKFIWKNEKKLNRKQVQKSQQFEKCIKKFPQLKNIFENQINQILYYLKNWQHDYIIHQGKIAYKQEFGITYDLCYGYKTIFAYFYQVEKSQILQSVLKQKIQLRIKIANISYTEIVKSFKHIIGVTGSVFDQNSKKIQQLCFTYNLKFRAQFRIPSAFGSSKLSYNQIIVVSKQKYYEAIFNQIASIEQNRPILLFFKNKYEANIFYNSTKFYSLKHRSIIIQQDCDSQLKQSKISKSTSSGNITILTQYFSKGIDFRADEKINQSGGIHIIQTYLSDSNQEETQLLRRCAQQRQRGSYRLIIIDQNLQKFKIHKNYIEILKENISADLKYQKLRSLIKNKRSQQFYRLNSSAFYYDKKYRQLHNLPQLMKNFKNSDALKKQIKSMNEFPDYYSKTYKIIIGLNIRPSIFDAVQKLKRCIPQIIQQFNKLLKKQEIRLLMQIATYKNYCDPAELILTKSTYQNSPYNLLRFLNNIKVNGGFGDSQAIQLLYDHVLKEKDINHVIIISDSPQNTKKETLQMRQYFGQKYWQNTQYGQPVFVEDLLIKLKNKQIPIDFISINLYQQNSNDELFISFFTNSIKKVRKGINLTK